MGEFIIKHSGPPLPGMPPMPHPPFHAKAVPATAKTARTVTTIVVFFTATTSLVSGLIIATAVRRGFRRTAQPAVRALTDWMTVASVRTFGLPQKKG